MKHWMLALALAASLAVAPAALATPLAPNSSVSSIATIDLSSPPEWDEVDSNSFTIENPGVYVLRMSTKVLRDEDTGFLDFLYTVENERIDAAAFNVSRLTIAVYPTASITDVFFVAGSGVEPAGADRNGAGTIGFNFGDQALLEPGTKTTILIRTQDTKYREGEFGAEGPETVSVASFAPDSAPSVVPLPGSLMLGLSGLVSLAGGLFRRFRKGLTPAL